MQKNKENYTTMQKQEQIQNLKEQILKIEIEEEYCYKNEATGEYESPYQFHLQKFYKDDGKGSEKEYFKAIPTDESIVNYELKNNYTEEERKEIINHFKFQQVKKLYNDQYLANIDEKIKELLKEIDLLNITASLSSSYLKKIKELQKYINERKKDKYDLIKDNKVIMYHGTSKKHNIVGNNGLGKTGTKKAGITAGPIGYLTKGFVYLADNSQRAI